MATWIAAVRHPQKQDDVDRIHRGDQSQITEEGERQAAILIDRVRSFDIDIVLSSDTPRTALLGTRIGAAIGCKVETNALFREWQSPSFMLNRSMEELAVKETKRLLREGFDSGHRFFDEESKPMLEARNREITNFLLNYPRQRLLLLTHAKTIAGLVTQTFFGSLDGYYRGPDRALKLDHTGITTFVQERDRRDGTRRLVVQSVNDISHFDRFYQEAHSILGAAE